MSKKAKRKTPARRKASARKAKPPARVVTPGAIGTTLRQNLLSLAHELARLEDESLARVSRRINTDHKFFGKLEANECSFTVRKYDEMIEKFAYEWPVGATMPALIDPTHGSAPPPQPKKDSKHGARSKEPA